MKNSYGIKRAGLIGGVTIIGALLFFALNPSIGSKTEPFFTGSEDCRSCHTESHESWASSMHGMTMQEVTPSFIANTIDQESVDMVIGEFRFQRIPDTLSLRFYVQAGDSTNEYKARYAIGGKYVFHFLTEFAGGRLQVLPISWDITGRKWYNNPESGVRHLMHSDDQPLSWNDPGYTFNSSCYSCHVSQVTTNFNIETLSYNTFWQENGINCESCHGPGSEHVSVYTKRILPIKRRNPKIISVKSFTHTQHNHSCASCHAKMIPLTTAYPPGEDFYDHFDLTTIEIDEFYPDGRDLGENYTFTSWEMNACAASSDLTCLSCHTSGGAGIFAGGDQNRYCLPCHNDKADKLAEHTKHKISGEGSKCINCHMPKTSFAFMTRSDHSFRPPHPAATIKFNSPNACNLCHTDKSPQWANQNVQREKGDYQKAYLMSAGFINEMKNGDFSNLETVSKGIIDRNYDPVTTTAFLRLMKGSDSYYTTAAATDASTHPHPLVRAASAGLLLRSGNYSPDLAARLTSDPVRVVRLSAGRALIDSDPALLYSRESNSVTMAAMEYVNSLVLRSDNWSGWYNMGNILLSAGDINGALNAFRTSCSINPGALMPRVNSAIALGMANDLIGAEKELLKANEIEPDNETVLFNLALVYSEKGDSVKAIACFERVITLNNSNMPAAGNLSLLLVKRDPVAAKRYGKLAMDLANGKPRQIYNYAWILYETGDLEEASILLERELNRLVPSEKPYPLLIKIYVKQGLTEEAKNALSRAIAEKTLNQKDQSELQTMISRGIIME